MIINSKFGSNFLIEEEKMLENIYDALLMTMAKDQMTLWSGELKIYSGKTYLITIKSYSESKMYYITNHLQKYIL